MSGEPARRVPALSGVPARRQRLTVAVAGRPKIRGLEALLRALEQDALQAVRDQLNDHRPLGSVTMARVRAFLITVIILALAVHLVWVALAPLIPYVIGGLIALSALGLLYFRKRW